MSNADTRCISLASLHLALIRPPVMYVVLFMIVREAVVAVVVAVLHAPSCNGKCSGGEAATPRIGDYTIALNIGT